MATFPSDSVRTKNWITEILTDSDLETQLDLLHDYIKAALNSSTGHSHDGTSNQGPKISPANLLIASQAQGDILYASSASAWARLGAGTSGQFLKTQGAAANPIWADISAIATQSEMETATNNTNMVTPLAVNWHPGVAKAWCSFNGTGTPAMIASHNFDSSITDSGIGLWTLSLTTDMSSSNYCAVGMSQDSGSNNFSFVCLQETSPMAAGTLKLAVVNFVGTPKDPSIVCVALFGDQ